MNYDPERRYWSVLTKTYGGTVSILKELTLAEAIAAYERLDPLYGRYWPEPEPDCAPIQTDTATITFGQRCVSIASHFSDGDIELREILGPPEWSSKDQELPSWPRHRTD